MNCLSKLILASFAGLLASSATLAAEDALHPCQQFATRAIPAGYGSEHYGLPAEASINDVTFVAQLPDPATLSKAERYMVAGLSRRPRGPGQLPPWYEDLLSVIHPHLFSGGQLPSQLSDEYLEDFFGAGYVPENWLPHFLKSPIHGGYPRLDAREFSAGDVFVHALTEEEMLHIAQHDATLRALINNEPLQGTQMQLIEPVLYIRAYGHDKVIMNTLHMVYYPINP